MKVFKENIWRKRNGLCWLSAVITAIVLGSSICGTTSAVPVYYFGADPGAGSSNPRPNSNAAAAAFDAAAASGLGPINIINFEAVPPGNFTSLTVAPGVTATQINNDMSLGGIVTEGFATPHGAPTGYNVTEGGRYFLGFVPKGDIGTATLMFKFETPIWAWGAYIVGLEESINGDLFIEFNDGVARSFELVDNTVAGIEFFGFTDLGTSITEISLVLRKVSGTRDIYGIDEVRYVAIPEPATLLLLGLGRLGLLKRRR